MSPNLSTAKLVVKISDRLLAIFPEEARYFQALGGNVNWVGHPFLASLGDLKDIAFQILATISYLAKQLNLHLW